MPLKGYKQTKEHKEKIAKTQIGEKNSHWNGNEVGYQGVHRWIRLKFPKPKLCQCCKKVPPYDLANKGIYNRDIKNWEWLCRRCHMLKDGRMNNLKQFKK